jgi:hypothetical protein
MAKKDWKGDTNSVFKSIGASNHSEEDRHREDFYATEPLALELLLKMEKFSENVWEPACGMGHMSNILSKHGYNVKSSDLFDRGFGEVGVDFLGIDNLEWNGDIITNPPYLAAKEFIEKSLQITQKGNKVAMFLKLTFMEGKSRKHLFTTFPPKVIYISSSRLLCAKNGEFDKTDSSAVAYAWYIWEKGYKGDTIVKWFN